MPLLLLTTSGEMPSLMIQKTMSSKIFVPIFNNESLPRRRVVRSQSLRLVLVQPGRVADSLNSLSHSLSERPG